MAGLTIVPQHGDLSAWHMDCLPQLTLNINCLAVLMNKLINRAVSVDLLAPVDRALDKFRLGHGEGSVLPIRDFVARGILRRLKALHTRREQSEALLHLEPSEAGSGPSWRIRPRRVRSLSGITANGLPALVKNCSVTPKPCGPVG